MAALTYTQIVTLGCQIAKCPGYTSQGGQLLIAILQELAQTYDFDAGGRGLYSFNFNTALGSGPIPLPADYLRAEPDDFFYTIDGVKYPLINVDLAEFDALVQQPGLQNYPTLYATDMSTSPPSAYVWMPPSGAYPVTLRYRKMPAVPATPESDTGTPWFANSSYLVTRVSADLMQITSDDRRGAFLKEAEDTLSKYLKLKDDREARADRVHLDRRRFGSKFSQLPNTKVIGW